MVAVVVGMAARRRYCDGWRHRRGVWQRERGDEERKEKKENKTEYENENEVGMAAERSE